MTPLLTTMGLGGLAVAFGLRETLANLFSGMNFTLAGNINVGDFVKLGWPRVTRATSRISSGG